MQSDTLYNMVCNISDSIFVNVLYIAFYTYIDKNKFSQFLIIQ